MSQSKVKVQINSLEAIERLIGGDSELEVEIRNQIVGEFTKKNLRQIADSKTFIDLFSRLRQDIFNEATIKINEQIGEFKKSTSYPYVTNCIKLHPDIASKIQQLVISEVDNIIIAAVHTIVKTYTEGDKLEKLIEERVSAVTKAIINDEVTKRIKIALEIK